MNTNTLRIQTNLKRLGFDPGAIDGIMGPKTMANLNKYLAWRQAQPKGPDISRYQERVDFDKLSKTCDFLIMRTSASLSKDVLFKEHWAKAGKAGIKRGIYHFFTPWQDPIKQAELIMECLGQESPDVKIILDVEAVAPKPKKGVKPIAPVSSSELIKRVRACLEALEILAGHKPIIYTYSAFSKQHKLGEAFGSEYDVWMADYRKGPAEVSKGWVTVVAHQYIGDEGTWEGVVGACDGNYLEVPLGEVLIKPPQSLEVSSQVVNEPSH